MQHQSTNIGIVIWGVRNGFEIIHASNRNEAEYLKSDVITDNMRQVCNAASKRFYSVHRNEKFAAATIYSMHAQDVVGRSAYIAITLYIPISHRFVGNVTSVLNGLMDFYIHKQGNATVNMFTEDMIRDQFVLLNTMHVADRISIGSKSGYVIYQQEEEIQSRLEELNIDGYKVVLFLLPDNQNAAQQLINFEAVSSFVKTFRITINDFDTQRFSARKNNTDLSNKEFTFHVDGFPGDVLSIIEKSSGRKQDFHFREMNLSYDLNEIFKSKIKQEESGSGSRSKSGSRREKDKNAFSSKIIILLSLIIVLCSLLIWQMDNFFGDNPPVVPEDTTTVNQPPVEDTSKIDTATIKVDTAQKVLKKVKEIFGIKTLTQKQFGILKKNAEDNIEEIQTLEIFANYETIIITIKPGKNNQKDNIISKIKAYKSLIITNPPNTPDPPNNPPRPPITSDRPPLD